ncbi:MAG TPA: hypothetical protein VE971_03800 [Candidatus Eisenbacteria bacterium]|nr:hypothetical protein [Candidatus Eisenbacteria bacterium]
MTAEELRSHFNNTFALGKWPDTFEVDSETYGNVCQSFFNWAVDNQDHWTDWDNKTLIHVALGPNNGIMFKDVELILKRNNNESSNHPTDHRG